MQLIIAMNAEENEQLIPFKLDYVMITWDQV